MRVEIVRIDRKLHLHHVASVQLCRFVVTIELPWFTAIVATDAENGRDIAHRRKESTAGISFNTSMFLNASTAVFCRPTSFLRSGMVKSQVTGRYFHWKPRDDR